MGDVAIARVVQDGVAGFDPVAYAEWEAARYGIDLKQVYPSPDLATPVGYLVNVEVEQGSWHPITYYYITDDEQISHFLAWYGRLVEERHAKGKLPIIGWDYETSGLSPFDDKLATLQLGNPLCKEPRAYVFDLRCVTSEGLAPVLALLDAAEVAKLGQNVKFECKWGQRQQGLRPRNVWDTQVAEMVIRTGLFSKKDSSHPGKGEDRAAYKHTSMAALCRRYLGIDIDKDHDLRTSFYKTPPGEHSLRQVVYAAGDVIYPFWISKYQSEEIAARKLSHIIKIEMAIIPILADMELTGLRIDVKAWRVLWQEAVKRRAEAEAALDEKMLTLQPDLFGGSETNVRPIYTGSRKPQPLNYSSAPQVKWALQQYCKAIGWPVQLLTTELQVKKLKARCLSPVSTDPEWVWAGRRWLDEWTTRTIDDLPDWILPESQYLVLLTADKIALTLAKCRKQLPADFVNLLVTYSKYDIRCDTFGNEYIKKNVRADSGCVHTEFHQCVTSTGRFSSSPNLQNWPSDQRYRRCAIPKPGYAFVILDYSQIEPRISAQCSKDPVYMNTFWSGLDLYLEVAAAMLGYRPDKSTPEGKLERKIFKTVVLALAYNMGKWKLRDRLTVALEEEIMAGKVTPPTFEYASELWDKFFVVHEKIREMQLQCIHDGSPTHKVDGFGGKKELVPNPRRIWDDFLQAEVTWVTAPCGRKRFFPPDAKNTWTEAPNVPPQGGSATITKAAMVMIQERIDRDGWDAHVVNAVHDELVYEVRMDQAEAFAKVVKECMEACGQFYCPDVPIKAEFPEGSDTGVVMWWAKEVDEDENDRIHGLLEAA